MSQATFRFSLAGLAAAVSILVYGAAGSGAAAQSAQANAEPVAAVAAPVAPATQTDTSDAPATPAPSAASLGALVAQQDTAADLPKQIQCLASAIYFEAGHESLAGQLAVGRVIVARSRSGRFPDSYCGVVYQPSQFAFVHGGAAPSIRTTSAAWRNSVAIARIAHDGSWQSEAEGALFFHSVRSAARWTNRTRVARIDNHIFYR